MVAKKGADPESSTSSISPRKGVELSQENPIPSLKTPDYDLLPTSDEGMGIVNDSTLYNGNMLQKNTQSKIIGSGNEEDSEKENLNIPSPQLIQKKGKSNSNFSSKDWNSQEPLLNSSTTLGVAKVSKTGHFKPTTADDPSASSNQVSYIPIFMIVALVVLVIVVVAVGYRRLKDIWARRHYNYVDFLIDGMYE